uniref:Potassium large conductance calcium-activated channel, subfamily M, beta member 2a n=2 Tax=Paramormyrops kingsleyae TaxID=1676925 RepID=A0A3B3QJ42_9TELE|nr:calcium-activated potassium channel subunit beta-2-like isoform X2 [Paramormyrops kingsleyae]
MQGTESFRNSRSKMRSVQTTVKRPPDGADGDMFLLTGNKGPQSNGRRKIYQKIHQYELKDKRKAVRAYKAGEDRAILLGLTMVICAAMMYFILGVTVVRPYLDSVWTEESICTVLNSTVIAEMNCSYSCGIDCRGVARYPCLQVFVRINASGRIARLSQSEDSQELSSQCFYMPKCNRDQTMARVVIRNITERLRVRQRLPCFHDPSEQQENVLLTRQHGDAGALQSLLWPSCVLTIGLIIVLMVKLTQYLSTLCDNISRDKR